MNRRTIAKWEDWIREAARRIAFAAPLRVDDLRLDRMVETVVHSFTAPDVLRIITPMAKENGPEITKVLYLAIKTGLMPGGPAPEVVLLVRRPGGRNSKAPPVFDFLITARGAQRIAYEMSGCIVTAHVVRDVDQFEFEYGSNQMIRHVPSLEPIEGDEWDAIVAAYALVKRPGVEKPDFLVMSKRELQKRRECAGRSRAWVDWPGEMCEKTVVLKAIRSNLAPGRDEVRSTGTDDWRIGAAVIENYQYPGPGAVDLRDAPEDEPEIACQQCGVVGACGCEPPEEV